MHYFGTLLAYCSLYIVSVSIVGTNGCGCGSGCGEYASSPMQCARCCSQLVKRSLDDFNHLSIANDETVRPSVKNDGRPYFVFVEKRDTCGCHMGCFYSSPMECARCCSHGVRRNVQENQQPSRVANERRNDAEDRDRMLELNQLLKLLFRKQNEGTN